MTGKPDHSGTDGTGRTPERATPSRARGIRYSQATPVPIGVGAVEPIPDSPCDETIVTVTRGVPPAVLPRTIRTQVSYRQLVASGLTGAEAAGLIGYVSGLPTKVSPWTMTQINRLLFLRSIYNESEWGEAERKPGN